jgi:hypothetical protein
MQPSKGLHNQVVKIVVSYCTERAYEYIACPSPSVPVSEFIIGEDQTFIACPAPDVVETEVIIRATENAASSAAPDPELEDYYRAVKTSAKPVSKNTPLAAWVLLTLFMLSYIQQNAASNIIGEIFQLYAAGNVNGFKRTIPYFRRDDLLHDIGCRGGQKYSKIYRLIPIHNS